MALPKAPEVTPSVESAPAPAPTIVLASTIQPPVAAKPADLNCLAKAVYYEARGESADGQAAVAQVVINRTHRPSYPSNVCGVVFQGLNQGGCQFSFVCDGAMRRPLEPVAWSRARQVASNALRGHVMKAVGQALNFHVVALGSEGRGQIARIGGHVFFVPGKAHGGDHAAHILRLAGPSLETVSPTTPSMARDAVAVMPAVVASNTETAPTIGVQ